MSESCLLHDLNHLCLEAAQDSGSFAEFGSDGRSSTGGGTTSGNTAAAGAAGDGALLCLEVLRCCCPSLEAVSVQNMIAEVLNGGSGAVCSAQHHKSSGDSSGGDATGRPESSFSSAGHFIGVLLVDLAMSWAGLAVSSHAHLHLHECEIKGNGDGHVGSSTAVPTDGERSTQDMPKPAMIGETNKLKFRSLSSVCTNLSVVVLAETFCEVR
jgi:hypothetical protein